MLKRNLYIDFIKFPMALLVIYAHVPGRPELHLDTDSCYLSILSFICFIPSYLTGIAMRSFFVISGYLFYKNLGVWNHSLFFEKIKKRYKILVPSYILWITLFVILLCVLYHKNPLEFISKRGIMNVYLGFDDINTMMTKCYPLLYPMWYVRDLLVALTISPVLYWILKTSPWGFLSIILFYLFFDIPTSAFFFVSIGIFIALYGQGINSFISISYLRLLIITTAVMIFVCSVTSCKWTFTEWGDLLRSAITMLAIYLLTKDLKTEDISKYGKCSYFIFAFHPFPIEMFLKVHYTKLSIMNVDLTIPYAFVYLLFPVLIYCVGYNFDKFIKGKSSLLTRLLCAS